MEKKCKVCGGQLPKYRWNPEYCSENCSLQDGSDVAPSILEDEDSQKEILYYLKKEDIPVSLRFFYWDIEDGGLRLKEDLLEYCEEFLEKGKCPSSTGQIVRAESKNSWFSIIKTALEF